MSRMNELSCSVNDIKAAISLLESVVETLNEMFSAQEPALAAPAPKPITKEEVRAVLAAKTSEGYGAQVRALLKKFGAAQLSAVEPDHYHNLMLQAQAIGNEVGADG